MRSRLRNDAWRPAAICCLLLLASIFGSSAAGIVLQLKNGDRLTGRIVSESTNSITLATPFLGTVQVPLAEINKREPLPELEGKTNAPPPAINAATNAPPATIGTNSAAAAATNPALKPSMTQPPLKPANPEATSIASTPKLWKHDIRFGLNTRYATMDSQEILILAKSTYGKPPFRHIFDANLKYGTIEGVVSANSVTGSEKTEYQLTPKTYLFNLVGGGFDQIRHIDAQGEIGPGFGMELLKRTNFVWKGEAGFNFQQQYRSDDTQQTSYSIRIAEIFAWRVWEKLTADVKLEFYPNLGDLGQYRFRFENNFRYPVSEHLSLNLDLIDLYDSQPAHDVTPNDLQIRSTIGVTF